MKLPFFSNNHDAKAAMSIEEAAKFLGKTPAAMKAFEEAYQKQVLNNEDVGDNFFNLNSRHMASMMKEDGKEVPENIRGLLFRIVDELVAGTELYTYDGRSGRVEKKLAALPAGTALVATDEVNALPVEARPQCTGSAMCRDIEEPAYLSLLWHYQRFQKAKTQQEKTTSYGMFRSGLDTLDLDPVTYAILGMNRNSIGNWFPQLVDACMEQDILRLPATTIARVPMNLLQLSRLQYETLTRATLDIVDLWAFEVFGLDVNKEYFIRNGTSSSKFDFRNAHVHGEQEVRELGEYLLFGQYQGQCMAHFTVQPHPIYGVATTNEWVVREFIPDKENNPTIYKGLPLRTEYRVFIDCDTDMVLGIHPYWDPKVMKARFNGPAGPANPHDAHDAVTYAAAEPALMARYEANKDKVVQAVQAIVPKLDLHGQWSLDVMQNGDEFWAIDMAVAENSAFYHQTVPLELRRPSGENWIPELPEPGNT